MTNSTFKGIIDMTCRDGQQSPLLYDANKYRFNNKDKKVLINGMLKLGVKHFEFFSPVVSHIEKDDFAEIQSFVKEQYSDVKLLAHVRCHIHDIEQAIHAGFDGLNMYISITKLTDRYSAETTHENIVSTVIKTLTDIRSTYPHLYLRFSIEDSFRTNWEDMLPLYDAVVPFVNTIGIPDTVGMATPALVRHRITTLKKKYPNTDIECHFHNDRGYSLINAVTAVLSGASFIDTSIWGLAERSGITSMTGLLFDLFYEDPEYVKQYTLELCYPLNVLMGTLLHMHVPPTEPVSLTNRTHAAGVHQKAVIHNHEVYEAHELDRFGVNKNQLLLGPLSGWNSIYYFLREVKFYDITPEQAKEIASIFKDNAASMKKNNPPEKVLMDIVEKYSIPLLAIDQEHMKERIEYL